MPPVQRRRNRAVDLRHLRAGAVTLLRHRIVLATPTAEAPVTGPGALEAGLICNVNRNDEVERR